MVICGVCGQAYDDMKEKHVCPGPLDLDKPATMRDIEEIKLKMARDKSEIFKLLAMLSGRIGKKEAG